MVGRGKDTGLSPVEQTVIIGNVKAMWEKLHWEVDAFSDIQSSYPTETQPICYAAINVCIAAWSLEQWAWSAVSKRDRRTVERAFRQRVRDAIPAQGRCADIANTAKHSRHRDDNSQGERVELRWEPGDEDVPSGWMLYHVNNEGRFALALGVFAELSDQWWHLLVELQLATGSRPTPEWLQKKLDRMFPQHLLLAGPFKPPGSTDQ